jgi:hypothetical protein
MSAINQTSTQLIGDAGEYYIAFQLAKRGINPSITNRNSKNVDILATKDGQTAISIQVKTSEGKTEPRKWFIGKKPNYSRYYFYIFVNIYQADNKGIECFIVPSKWVHDNVDWNKSNPVLNAKNSAEFEAFLHNWKPITDILNTKP